MEQESQCVFSWCLGQFSITRTIAIENVQHEVSWLAFGLRPSSSQHPTQRNKGTKVNQMNEHPEELTCHVAESCLPMHPTASIQRTLRCGVWSSVTSAAGHVFVLSNSRNDLAWF